MTASEDEPPIREFADRGIIWLLESPQNLADLLRMLSAELAARLDFSRAERRNRSFVPPNLHKQEADLLYRVPFLDPKSCADCGGPHGSAGVLRSVSTDAPDTVFELAHDANADIGRFCCRVGIADVAER